MLAACYELVPGQQIGMLQLSTSCMHGVA